MPTAITKQHAIVHTAAIDVKIMRLEKKQVTLSVFRQLEEQSIFAPGEAPPRTLGKPWGRVNYIWKGCPEWASYYLVWQLEGELRRMPCTLVDGESRYEVIEREYGCSGCGRIFDEEEFYRCHLCRKKPSYFNNRISQLRVEGLFDWLDLCEFYVERESKECKKDYRRFIVVLRRFEQLDQLFIAV